jgi:hypothetical protein
VAEARYLDRRARSRRRSAAVTRYVTPSHKLRE